MKTAAGLIPEGRTSSSSVREGVARIRQLRKRIAHRTQGKAKLSFKDFKSARDEGRKSCSFWSDYPGRRYACPGLI